jgi:hypothetical protein
MRVARAHLFLSSMPTTSTDFAPIGRTSGIASLCQSIGNASSVAERLIHWTHTICITTRSDSKSFAIFKLYAVVVMKKPTERELQDFLFERQRLLFAGR